MPCPVFPPPLKTKASLLKIALGKRGSWLDGLYERSYTMKMGHVWFPGLDLFMVNQPDLVRRVMADEPALFPKHRLLGEILEPLLGESIFTTNGAQWKKQRDMLDPAFVHARVQRVFGLMQAAVDELLANLDAAAGAAPIDMDHHMTYATADIIFRTILSARLEPDVARRIMQAFTRFQAETPRFALLKMFGLPAWLDFGRRHRRRLGAAREIRAQIESIVRPRYDQARGGDHPAETSDILSSLLAARDEATGAPFSFGEIVDQVCMLFLAGHETSASALSWTLYLLAIHPEIQQQAHEEVAGILQGQPLAPDHVKRMAGLRDIFREALRLYPPVGFLARECAADTTMRDKHVRKGSAVMVSPWLIHRHRGYWERPDDFDPGRFAREKPGMPLRDIYLPFGSGPRICIGAAFAMQEAVLILASLLLRYRFELAEGFVPQPVGRLTIRSENGMHMVLKRRDAQ